jgi:hypothetical protein
MAVLGGAAKVALLVFLAGGVLVILVTYYRRRRAGVLCPGAQRIRASSATTRLRPRSPSRLQRRHTRSVSRK